MSPKVHPLPFYNPLDPTHPRIWPDYTLVMPTCAVGNIGQLACDLIISTLLDKQQCQLIGRIHSPALMSVVGPNAFALNGPPTTSTEVYESKQHKLVIIQQRTSYFKRLRNLYIEELIQWVKEAKFDKVLVLTSSFAQCNPDTSQLGLELAGQYCSGVGGGSISSITTNLFETNNENWSKLNIKIIPDKRSIKVIQDGLTFLPGSGITKPLIKAFERAFIPAAFLVNFCSEGINIQDCYQVVNIVDKFLNLGYGAKAATAGATITTTMSRQVVPVHNNRIDGTGGDGDDYTYVKGDWVEPYSWAQAQC